MTERLPGRFIVLEGGEGSGKSTQVGMLASWLRSQGREVTVAREPGTTPLGERIRSTVLGKAELEVPARSELFLMLAARAAFVDQVVTPALRRGEVVISDRFEMSTFAYQGAGRGLPLDEVRSINSFATGGCRPDLTLLLDVDPGEGARRQGRQGKSPDRLEAEAADFHERVRAGYRALAAEDPAAIIVPADPPAAEVHRMIREAVEAILAETFASSRVMDSRPD